MQDYFSLFELIPSFDLNLTDLEKRYFAAQRLFHPDRLVGKSAAERQAAISRSMQANEAYEALKNPLSRAQHVLALNGATEQKPSQALLMEIMGSREALSEAADKAAIDALAQSNAQALKTTLEKLSLAFATADFAQAAQLTLALSYHLKMEGEVRIRRKSLAA